MNGLSKSTIAAAVAIVSSTASQAADVELKSSDGFVSIEGEILAVDADMITVKTGYGTVRVPRSEVECHGKGCPNSLVADLETPEGRIDTAFGEGRTRFFQSGQSALAVLSAPLSLEGSEKFQSPEMWADPDLTTRHEIGLRVMAAVAGPSVGVDALSVNDLARIYSGDVLNWSELGGNDLPIIPITVKPGTATYEDLVRVIMAPERADFSGAELNVHDALHAVQLLDSVPGAVTVVQKQAIGDSTPLRVTDACGRMTQPDPFFVSNGTYPLTVGTYVVSGQPVSTPVIAEFLDGMAATAVQGELPEGEFDEPSIFADDGFAKSMRLRHLLAQTYDDLLKPAATSHAEDLFSAEQLAVSFYDGSVGDAVAAHSRAGLARLSEAIVSGRLDGKTIEFVGFSAAGKDAQSGLDDSLKSADRVLAAFQKFAPDASDRTAVRFSTTGYGSLGFENCPTSVRAQTPNLVEVWVRDAT